MAVNSLVIVHVVAGVVDAVQVVKREPGEEDSHHLDRAIYRADEIVEKGTSSFDRESDDCRIFAVDDDDGSSHEVWSYGSGSEDHGEGEEE